MLDIIKWLFERITEITQFMLDVHIIGDLSLLHFILGFNLLILFISFISFGYFHLGNDIDYIYHRTKNAENQKVRQAYYNERIKNYESRKSGFSYRYNPKTGEYRKM